jgi:DHA1 family inner membrane transport protein
MPLAVFSLMLVIFGLTTGEFVIAGILPDVATELAVSIPAAGLLVTAYAVGMIIGGPVVTVLTARLARKPLILGLVGVSVLGAPIGTFIGQHLGWRATFGAVASVGLVALVLVARYVPARAQAATGSVLGELRVFADRDVQLAIALTAVGNVGIVTVFSYLAPLFTEVSGFAADAVPVLLLVYGAGAVLGNFVGGWLSDRALLPSLAGLLAALAGVLALAWLCSGVRPVAAVLTFALGLLAFAIVPGLQLRVVATAGAAPTLAVAVNAAGFQLAAAFAGWLGGRVIDGPGPRAIYLVGALLTVVGLGVAGYALRRGRRAPDGAAAAGRAQ